MAFLIVLAVLLLIAALAPAYGVDSRGLGESTRGSGWPASPNPPLPNPPLPELTGPLSLASSDGGASPVVPKPRAAVLRAQRDLVP